MSIFEIRLPGSYVGERTIVSFEGVEYQPMYNGKRKSQDVDLKTPDSLYRCTEFPFRKSLSTDPRVKPE